MEQDPHSESDADLDFSDIPAVDALRRHLDNAGEFGTKMEAGCLGSSAVFSGVAEQVSSTDPWHRTRGLPLQPAPPPWAAEGDPNWILATRAPFYSGLPPSTWPHSHAGLRHSGYPYAGDMPPTSAHYPSSSSSSYPGPKPNAATENGSHSKAGSARSSYAATSRSERPRLKGRTRSDLWCEIFLDEQMLDMGDFEVEKKLIGKGGCNTKSIFLATGSKILVCGQGAERGKVRRKRMSHDHLRIEIVSDRQAYSSFRKAFDLVVQLIIPISDDFDRFCVRQLSHKLEGRRYWIGSTTQQALHCLGHLLENHHITVAHDALEDARDARRSHPALNSLQLNSALGKDESEEKATSPPSYEIASAPPQLIDSTDPAILEAEEAVARHIREVEELVEDPGHGSSSRVAALQAEGASAKHMRDFFNTEQVIEEAESTRWQ